MWAPMTALTSRRRAALLAAAFVAPIAAVATTTPPVVATSVSLQAITSAPSSVAEAEAAERTAAQAEAEQRRASAAVPQTKTAISTALRRAQDARAKVQRHQPVVNNRLTQVNNRLAQVNKARAAVKKAKGPQAKAKARTRLVKAQTNLKNARGRLATARTTMGGLRTKASSAWTAWDRAKVTHENAKTYEITATRAAEKAREHAKQARAAVTVVTRAVVDVLPPVHQASATAESADAARHVVTVHATPSLPRLDVEVQRLDGGRWVNVATAVTRDDGRVDVPVPATSGAVQYRATVNGHVSNVDSPTQELIFTDEFTGATLGSAWNHRMQVYNPGGNRTCAKGDPSAVTKTAHTVRLWVTKDPKRTKEKCSVKYNGKTTKHAYRNNGHIATQHSFAFTYGTAAARVKVQSAARGQHSAFWMQPQSHSGLGKGPLHVGAEIDVFEFFGKRADDYSGMTRGIWWTNPKDEHVQVGGMIDDVSAYLADKDDQWFNRYHVFSVDWTPEEYVFRIDGQETFRTSVGVSGRPQYLIFTLLSPDYAIAQAGTEGEKTLGSQHIDVDWVRVWQ